MVNYEGLLRHLAVVDDRPFGLLSQQALPTAGLLATEFPDRLKALFSAEHGWFGLAGAGEKTESLAAHPFWHIPVHSLYGEHRRPVPEMYAGLSRVVVDLQDLGVRCFTYLATLKNLLETAAENGVAVTVLDRPIPLGGVLDGPRRTAEFSSFVAPLDIPLCHGMTPGECAQYIARLEGLDLDLTVIKMKDWSHADRTPWMNFTPPSPGIKSWDSAALYPATVFTEAFPALDCDRAGSLAFRVLGAPWLDVHALQNALADALPACGLDIRPFRYRPQNGLYADRPLDGLLLSIANPHAFYPVTGGTLILAALHQRHPQEIREGARPEWLDKLTGSTDTRLALESDDPSALFQKWIDAQDAYLPQRVDLYAR